MEANNSKFHAIIPAAGTSQRMGSNKLLLKINGLTVLERTVSRILETEGLSFLVIVSSKDNLETYKTVLKSQLKINNKIEFVEGGATREESVSNGINYLKDLINTDSDYVLVHDGARCLLSKSDLKNACDLVISKNAVSVATKVVDTLKKANSNLQITDSVDREDMWQLQTPQIFRADLLLKAHSDSNNKNHTATCDATLVSKFQDVFLYQSKSPNFKLTFESDLGLFQKLIESN